MHRMRLLAAEVGLSCKKRRCFREKATIACLLALIKETLLFLQMENVLEGCKVPKGVLLLNMLRKDLRHCKRIIAEASTWQDRASKMRLQELLQGQAPVRCERFPVRWLRLTEAKAKLERKRLRILAGLPGDSEFEKRIRPSLSLRYFRQVLMRYLGLPAPCVVCAKLNAVGLKMRVECAHKLTQASMSLQYSASADQKGLLAACFRGDADEAGSLLVAGVDPNVRDAYGNAPLHAAAFEGHGAVCGLLLKAGARVDVADKSRRTPLALAVLRNNSVVVEFLLANGADPNRVDANGDSPLHVATARENVCVARILTEAGARFDITNDVLYTPEYMACLAGNETLLKIMDRSRHPSV